MIHALIIILISATLAQAFKDTSPFLLFSSSPLPTHYTDNSLDQLQSKAYALEYAKSFLAQCPSDIYYVLTQPSISSYELSTSSPHLRSSLSNAGVNGSFSIAETLGLMVSDGDELVRHIQHSCGAKLATSSAINEALKEQEAGRSIVVRIIYDTLHTANIDRKERLISQDAALHRNILRGFSDDLTYTFIYTSTSPASMSSQEPLFYDVAFNEISHMDLKRDHDIRARNASESGDSRPLFERYQFLSPGLFMGILVCLILLAILGVGIGAVSSLEVSYGAFDKEMGPAAQKK